MIMLAGSQEAGANGGGQCLNLCARASFWEDFFEEFYCLITLAGSHEAGANGGRQCLNLCAPASFGEALFWEGFWRVLGEFWEICEDFKKNETG